MRPNGGEGGTLTQLRQKRPFPRSPAAARVQRYIARYIRLGSPLNFGAFRCLYGRRPSVRGYAHERHHARTRPIPARGCEHSPSAQGKLCLCLKRTYEPLRTNDSNALPFGRPGNVCLHLGADVRSRENFFRNAPHLGPWGKLNLRRDADIVVSLLMTRSRDQEPLEGVDSIR